jgi:very-short-patch-repair endonuclease
MGQNLEDNEGCLGLLMRLFDISPDRPAVAELPYRLRDDFLSPAELSFYHVLLAAAGQTLTVCPKVNLSDVLFVSRPDQYQAARNRIDRKHVDFLLCDRRTMRPLAGIELDDASHAREDRQARDAFVQEVFAAANLPLLRFPVQRTYDPNEVAARLTKALATESPAAAPPQDAAAAAAAAPSQDAAAAPSQDAAAPVCPKCGISLVIRNGRYGQFYGCANYPRCRQTAQVP